ncbi:MAG: hypothetical protein ACQKBT_11740 [Puniceicoccales bacterium]
MKGSKSVFSKKFAIPILSGIIILVCLITLGLRLSRLSELQDTIAIVEQEVSTMQRNMKSSVNLEEQLARIEELTDQIQNRVIEPEDTAVNTAYFYQFETGGVKIQSVEQHNQKESKKGNPWKMKNFGTTEFTIRATGTFHELLDFTYRIRGGQKLVRITSASLNPATGAGENQRSITMTLEALSILPEKK